LHSYSLVCYDFSAKLIQKEQLDIAPVSEVKTLKGVTSENLFWADCVVIATDHSCYNMDEVIARSKLVFDTCGMTRGLKSKNIIRLGE
jgi:UDP-N-acetyl-D-mannosaminuronate dehydrogenase